MQINQEADQKNGGIERLSADFEMMNISQATGQGVSVTIADSQFNAASFRFRSDGMDAFAINKHVRLAEPGLTTNTRSGPGHGSIEITSAEGHVAIERVNEHVFRISAQRRNSSEDEAEHWESSMMVETPGDGALILEPLATQTRETGS